ncbi:ROK family transcriptional regulator [Sediminispirochaeta smaragdinae]|uniref:ROK family protein n=1 Tax=Sediminispirochaeta smaragdinae (strain DSM 11293 / JCM 15392 / SEBR 4228) TaxID=573413 RepID=E1R358_SEDSS|nr:ROK family transcriptional regulator [Sediminispirochaeta smaragdinae]ADK81244.1 ROK family protein [Sediminispirochaeta smaragdinae DSM 11293]
MGQPKRTRIINSSRVIREMWIHGGLSRAALAQRLGLTKSSISSIIDELIKKEVISEGPEMDPGPKGGRKATKLFLNSDWLYVVGMEIRCDSVLLLAIDIEGRVLFSRTVKQQFSAESFSSDILALIKSLKQEETRLNRTLLGIGLGFSGIIDAGKQIIEHSVFLDFHAPFDFNREVASHCDIPIIIENDANCGAWGEVVFRRKHQVKNFLFLLIEFWKYCSSEEELPRPTIGLGFGFNGKIYHGTYSSAGEFKSLLNDDPNSSAQIRWKHDSDVLPLAKDRAALQEYIRELCRNVAFLVNTLDIGNLFIGGDIEEFKSFISTMLNEELRANTLTTAPPRCEIQFSALGHQAVAFGAAGLILDRVFMNLEALDEPSSRPKIQPLYFMEE